MFIAYLILPLAIYFSLINIYEFIIDQMSAFSLIIFSLSIVYILKCLRENIIRNVYRNEINYQYNELEKCSDCISELNQYISENGDDILNSLNFCDKKFRIKQKLIMQTIKRLERDFVDI